MKPAIRIVQVLVGVLFIISGLVKANDPLGLAYKMDEFFQLWMEGLAKSDFFAKNAVGGFLHFLDNHSLFLSVAMNTFEIVAGVALLAGWKKRLVNYFLLSLIIFFSFLTGYAYLSGKFSNCGCFGDCLPITPLTSFLKDLALLGAIIFLIVGERNLYTIRTNKLGGAFVISSLLSSLMLQWYVLNYLPLVDCLPLKKGNDISEQIKPPKNAIPSVYETRLVYENTASHQTTEMSNDEFNKSKIWENKDWKWKETKTRLIKEGSDIPKLHGFSLTTIDGEDKTDSILNYSDYLVLYWLNPCDNNRLDEELFSIINERGIKCYFVTTTPGCFREKLKNRILLCDGTIFRIGARVNPTIYLLKHGTILNKWPGSGKDDILYTILNLK